MNIDSCNFVSVKLITDVSAKNIKEQNCMNCPNCMQIRFSMPYAAFLLHYVVKMTVESSDDIMTVIQAANV